MEPKPTRPIVSKRLRFEIFRRDNFTCRYCGLHAGEDSAELTTDHVIPYALGGTAEPANLVTACKDCNAGKSSIAPGSPLVEDVAQDALRWSRAMTSALLIDERLQAMRNEYESTFQALWERCLYTDWRGDHQVPLPLGWQGSIGRFYDARLPIHAVGAAIDVAMGAFNVQPENRFRYFCGVCWRRIADLQEIARTLLAADPGD